MPRVSVSPPGVRMLLASAVLLLGTLSAWASDEACVDVQPPATGFGFFRRSEDCREVVERGRCSDRVAEGYCLLSCEACVVASPPAQEPAAEEAPPAVEDEELDPEAAAAAAYREELLEQVAIMEDGTAEVEELPSLMYDREIPPTPATDGFNLPPNQVAFASVEQAPSPEQAPVSEQAPSPEPQCDDASALSAIMGRNLTTLVDVAELMNVASVLNDTRIKFTLFAPDNSAWDVFPDLDTQLEDLQGTRSYLFSHIVTDQLLERLEDGKIEALSGAVLFLRDDGTRVISSAATGNVVETIVGCTWVVHVIDNVLGEEPLAGGLNPDFQAILRG